MSYSLGESSFGFMVCLKELMGEVLGHEGKHQIGSLGVRPELLSLKKPLSQNFRIRKNRFACRGRIIREVCIISPTAGLSVNASVVPTFGSHGERTVLRHRGQEPSVVGEITVGLPAEVSIFGVVSRGAGNHFTPDFREKRI